MCASGFGACCLFQIGCDSRSSENCTYFSSSLDSPLDPVATGVCSAAVCPCAPDVCQLRLDFLTFSLPGPSAATAAFGTAVNGDLTLDVAGPMVTTAKACQDAAFFASNPGGAAPPIICGQNTGEHSNLKSKLFDSYVHKRLELLLLVYVDASSACNMLTVTQNAALALQGAAEWLIKVQRQIFR